MQTTTVRPKEIPREAVRQTSDFVIAEVQNPQSWNAADFIGNVNQIIAPHRQHCQSVTAAELEEIAHTKNYAEKMLHRLIRNDKQIV